jgi:beta-glucosidase
VNVTNTGSMAGDDVVLAFISPPKGSVGNPSPPIKQLFGFERVHLNVNATAQIYFPLYINALLTVRNDGSKWLEPGLYQIRIRDKLIHTIELLGKAIFWSRLGE